MDPHASGVDPNSAVAFPFRVSPGPTSGETLRVSADSVHKFPGAGACGGLALRFIATVAVKVHRHNVMKKLEARSFADLVRMADALRIPRGN